MVALTVKFYRTEAGNEPVRGWLQSLSNEDRRTIGIDLWTVQEGWPLGMPLCRSLGKGLWEVRSSLSENREVRLLFYLKDDCIRVVNGFIKKTQQTAKEEIELALRRMKEWSDGD